MIVISILLLLNAGCSSIPEDTAGKALENKIEVSGMGMFSFGLIFVQYELLVRWFNVMRFLFGMSPKKEEIKQESPFFLNFKHHV